MTKMLLTVKPLLILLAFVCLPAHAGPVIDQSANLLTNGSFESGSFDPVVGHNVASAADNWSQWSNSGQVPTSELITEAEMLSTFGVGVIDGNAALKFTTGGAGDGGFSFETFGHPGWDVQGDVTFSGWVYVVSGTMGLFVGSNNPGHFDAAPSTTTGAWEFLSISKSGGPTAADKNNEPLLYSIDGPATFIVDSVWLNQGLSNTHPGMTVPAPATLLLLLAGLGLLAMNKKRA